MSGIGQAIARLRTYATAPGGHLWPLGEAYSPHGDESVDEAQAQLKADILAVLAAFTEPVESA